MFIPQLLTWVVYMGTGYNIEVHNENESEKYVILLICIVP